MSKATDFLDGLGDLGIGFVKLIGGVIILCSSAFTAAAGGALFGVAKTTENKATEMYSQTEEYRVLKEQEDSRLENLAAGVKEAEVQYEIGEISSTTLNSIKNDYQKDAKYSQKTFLKNCTYNSDNKEVQEILKKAKNLRIAGTTVCSIAGACFLVKCGLAIADNYTSSKDTIDPFYVGKVLTAEGAIAIDDGVYEVFTAFKKEDEPAEKEQ